MTDTDRLREAITKVAQLCVGQEDEAVDVVLAAARRFLALTETGPDYEAAAARVFEVHGYSYLDWPPKWDAAADKHRREARYIVDAALADYLTEDTR